VKVTRLRPAKPIPDHTQVIEKRRNEVNIPDDSAHDIPIASDSCDKIRKLGFTASMHINMYGEHFEIVSDPFDDGDCVAVRVTSGDDPEIRTLHLPIANLVGRADRFLKPPGTPPTL
jgi:hypothetical protein